MFNKEEIVKKWSPIFNNRWLSTINIVLPEEMINHLCYYAEYESIIQLSSGMPNSGKLPDLLSEIVNNYTKENSEKLEIKKTLFDTSINNICYELSDGTIRYPGKDPILNNIYDIYKYFPENFIKYIDPQFHRNKQIDKIV